MGEFRRPTSVISSSTIIIDPAAKCWKQQALNVAKIQLITKGEKAILCYVDDGVAMNNELIGRLKQPVTSLLPHGSFFGSHATFGATIVGGSDLGIFPKMQFESIQVLDPISGTGSGAAIVAAINLAKEKGLKCINLSLGSDSPDYKVKSALKKYCSDGISFAVIAAGNDAKQTDYPAAWAEEIPGVLSVAATEIDKNRNIHIASFSSFGITTISAPGAALKSIDHENNLDFVSGTSFATPIVSGTIAVLQSLRELNHGQVMWLFCHSAKKINGDKAREGYGHINILEMLYLLKLETIPELHIKNKKTFWSRIFG
jgi:hypothetical protein